MSWRSTCTRHLAPALVCLAVVSLAAPGHGPRAQNLEGAIMPGKVIRGHAELEADCGKCHVRFDRSAQPRLCLDCHQHRDVAADIRARTGYHGRIKDGECRACHTEHKGRDARIVILDERKFDHARTDFVLRGKHAGVACASCHRAGARHRSAASDCVACHRKEDRHKGALGTKCEACHNESDWKEVRFDHAKTRFPLRHAHAGAKCLACHGAQRYTDTPRDCLACHRKDDAHKGHFGSRCETCHSEAAWKPAIFGHDRDTRFALRGRHRAAKCESCHRGMLYRDRVPGSCHACHRDDDAHKGALGAKCESCHSENGWKGTRFDHDRDTRFPLRARHRDAKCASCHQAAGYREKLPSTCVGCHERDDRDKGHLGRYGAKCESCHTERGWKAAIFDHDRDTGYTLRGRHLQTRCDACHRGALYVDRTETRCFACHQGDDRHKRQLGDRCERCHGERNWRETTFDHSESSFPLRGRHAGVECEKCHLTPAFKDANAECASCHVNDDAHRQRLGPRCGQCHDVQSWKKWIFDHDRRTGFRLDGAHARITCRACHTQPVRDRPTLPSDCLSCHRKDDTHFGTFGRQCESCHTNANWRQIVKRAPAPPGRQAPLPPPERPQ